ncbi:PP0621 family protein [Paraburkholderia lacunae]|uniref:Deaminase n=1 Tax=Paraburkholderia lacunae TaxID=2211104 RepID=A0A370NGR0_9BURK|nr:PP0621 family protein [Paraburkholderia lacunae]RDK04763.1 deaminase [Paraburkholderia lacunae]
MRQIFLLILLFIVGQWLVKALRRHEAHSAQRAGAGANGAAGAKGSNGGAHGSAGAQPQLAEPMIRCVECGVHAPKSDSVVVNGQPFCSTAHAQRHSARPTGRDAR